MSTIKNLVENDCQKVIENQKITFENSKKENFYLKSFFWVLMIFCAFIIFILIITLVLTHHESFYQPLLIFGVSFSIISFLLLLVIYFLKMKMIKGEIRNHQLINENLRFSDYYETLNYQINDELNQIIFQNHFNPYNLSNKKLYFQKGLRYENDEIRLELNQAYTKEKKKWSFKTFDYQIFSFAKINYLKLNSLTKENTWIFQDFFTRKSSEENQELKIESKTRENDWGVLGEKIKPLLEDFFFNNYYFKPHILIEENEIIVLFLKNIDVNLSKLELIDQIDFVNSQVEIINAVLEKIEEKNLEMENHLKLAKIFLNK